MIPPKIHHSNRASWMGTMLCALVVSLRKGCPMALVLFDRSLVENTIQNSNLTTHTHTYTYTHTPTHTDSRIHTQTQTYTHTRNTKKLHAWRTHTGFNVYSPDSDERVGRAPSAFSMHPVSCVFLQISRLPKACRTAYLSAYLPA